APAGRETEPRQQGWIGSSPEYPIPGSKYVAERLIRVEQNGTVERIRGIYGFDLHQRGVSILRARHSAHRGRPRDLPLRCQKILLGGACLSQRQQKCESHAQDASSL